MEKDKILDSITKLIELTQKGRIKWEASSPEMHPIARDENYLVEGSVYTTSYKEKNLRIYQRKRRIDGPGGIPGAFLSIPRKYPYWREEFILEITDDTKHVLWAFPQVTSLGDLFKAVQYQVAGIDSLIDDLLTEE